MKALIAVFLFAASLNAQATTPQRYTETTLDVVSITETSPLAYENIMSGQLTIDHFLDTARLVLQVAAPECPAGLYCIQVMPAPIVIEFEALQVSENSCGSFVFTGIIDGRPHDGLLETLQVVDNTYNKCMHLNILDQYEVTYSTYSPWSQVTSEAKFKGPSQEMITLPVQPAASM